MAEGESRSASLKFWAIPGRDNPKKTSGSALRVVFMGDSTGIDADFLKKHQGNSFRSPNFFLTQTIHRT
jgi:hypothetical protein